MKMIPDFLFSALLHFDSPLPASGATVTLVTALLWPPMSFSIDYEHSHCFTLRETMEIFQKAEVGFSRDGSSVVHLYKSSAQALRSFARLASSCEDTHFLSPFGLSSWTLVFTFDS